MEYTWKHNRRFNAYSNYCVEHFGERIQKLSVNAGFSCPNRDGTLGTTGCIYCNNNAFNPSYCSPEKSITQQIEEGIEFHKVRYRRASKYIVYFQAFSNTYGSLEILKEKYSEALSRPEVIGLSIGTRPDCITGEILDYLAELNKKYFISIEYGVESCNNNTLERINRGHTFEQSVDAIKKTAARNIHTGIHIIFGLPCETKEEMLLQSRIISDLPVSSIKFHQLQIIKDTPLANDFVKHANNYKIFTLNEYIDFIIDFTERLNPSIIIERFTAEVPPRFLVKGGFGLLRTDQLLQKIEKSMEERDTWQGRLYKKNKLLWKE